MPWCMDISIPFNSLFPYTSSSIDAICNSIEYFSFVYRKMPIDAIVSHALPPIYPSLFPFIYLFYYILFYFTFDWLTGAGLRGIPLR